MTTTLPPVPPFPVLPQEPGHRALWIRWAEGYARMAMLQERERADGVMALIEQHGMWLTKFPSGKWGADIPGEPGNPDAEPNPRPGQPGHVFATAEGASAKEAVLKCAAAIRSGESPPTQTVG